MRESEYLRLDACDLARLVKKREVKASELLELAIARTEKVNPTYNAVVQKWYETARRDVEGGLPKGAFHGVPFLLKDNIPYRNTLVNYGSVCFHDLRSEKTHPLAERFDAAGLVSFGRTNMSEFGLMPTSISDLHGPTRNPWSVDHCPAGSSGGAAAAVAAGIVPMAHAGDGGGSIRIPASACGIFGLKTSRGRLPEDTHHEPNAIVSQLCVSKSVRDTAALLDACHGARPGERFQPKPPPGPYLEYAAQDPKMPLKIAFITESFSGASVAPECRAAVEHAAALCADLGHHVEACAPPIDGERFFDAFKVLWSMIPNYLLRHVSDRLKDALPNLVTQPQVVERALRHKRSALAAAKIHTRSLGKPPFAKETMLIERAGRHHGLADFWLAWNHLRDVGLELEAFLQRYDMLLTPTLGEPPQRIDSWNQKTEADLEEKLKRFGGFTPLCNATGNPAMSVPLFWNDAELPIGVQFIAGQGLEHDLLALAGQLERAQPWKDRRPDID